MIDQCIDNVFLIWRESLVGSAVILGGVGVGWWEGRETQRWTVRLVSWWLKHVVHPLIAGGTWARRAVTIAANNSLVCFIMMLLGSLSHVAWVGVVCVGMGLGVALRLMFSVHAPDGHDSEEELNVPRRRVLEVIGVALTGSSFALVQRRN